MGCRLYSKLGPYVECKNGPKDKTVGVRCCPSEKCPKYGSTVSADVKYCPVCGHGIGVVQMTRPGEKVTGADIYGAVGDDLYKVGPDQGIYEIGTDYLMPNCGYGEESKGSNKDDARVEEVTAKSREDDLKLFMNFFATQLQKLKDLYGPDNVTVKWGLISYWS